MTVQLPLKIDTSWTPEQVLAGAERLDLTQAMRLIRQQSDEWSDELFLAVADRVLGRLRAAHAITRQDDPLSELWVALYAANPAVAPTWLERFCQHRDDLDLLSMMAGKIDCRQDPQVITAAKALAARLAPGDTRLHTWLMGTAMRDALSRNRPNLFNLLVKECEAGSCRIENQVMSCNLLALWALSLREIGWTQGSIETTLATLLRAGADHNAGGWLGRATSGVGGGNLSPIRKTYYSSLVELLCIGIDGRWDEAPAMTCALQCVLDHGISWGQHDVMDTPSARIIRNHPRWRAAKRKEELDALVEGQGRADEALARGKL